MAGSFKKPHPVAKGATRMGYPRVRLHSKGRALPGRTAGGGCPHILNPSFLQLLRALCYFCVAAVSF